MAITTPESVQDLWETTVLPTVSKHLQGMREFHQQMDRLEAELGQTLALIRAVKCQVEPQEDRFFHAVTRLYRALLGLAECADQKLVSKKTYEKFQLRGVVQRPEEFSQRRPAGDERPST